MHSRCCWPPDSFSAGRSRSPPISSYRPARRSAPTTALSIAGVRLRRRTSARGALLDERVGDVVEDAHRERVGLLEDHRDAATQVVDLERVDVGAVERDLAAARGAVGDLGQAVERAQQRRLARARGADQREHLALTHRQAHVAHDPVLAVGQPHATRCAYARSRAWALAARRASARLSAAAVGRARRAPVGEGRRWARGRPRSSARAVAVSESMASHDNCSTRRLEAVFTPEPDGQARDERVQREHDHQQDERRRVGLLRGVAFARGGVVVDVARQRRAAAAQRCSRAACRRRPRS